MQKTTKTMNKKVFYLLSWTWGLPMTLIGLIVVSAILLYGLITKKQYRLKRHGWSFYLNVGKNWGGLDLGMFFLSDNKDKLSTKWHEFGHAIQNCKWGFLYFFIIWIPSIARYHYRKIKYTNKGLTPKTAFDSIWFEREASKLGRIYRNKLKLQ